MGNFEIFRSGRHCEIIGETLEYCRCREDPENKGFCVQIGGPFEPIPIEWGGSTFRALPGRYEEVDGLQYAGSFSQSLPDWRQSCEVRYKLMEGLSVVCGIDRGQVHRSQLIGMDQAVRKSIRAFIVGE